jgi:hypothetical protein
VPEDFGALEGFVARALSKNPDERFADANAMSQALEALELPGSRLPTVDRSAIPLGNDDVIASAPVQYPSTMPGFAPPVVGNRTPAAGNQAIPAEPPAPRTAAPSRPPPLAPSEREPEPDPSVAVPVSSSGRRVVLVLVLLGFVGATFATVLASGWFAPSSTASRDAGTAVDPVAAIAEHADELLAQGKSEAAVQELVAARKRHPQSALLAYQLGRARFVKLDWRDGLAAYRDAIKLDAARYREDPAMIRDVLRAFVVTPDFAPLAAFMHDDVGKAAAPFLDETAHNHPSAKIRARAAAELQRYK